MSSRFHCGWCLNLMLYLCWKVLQSPLNRYTFEAMAIGLGHYDPLSSHEIDGVRKEKERLTAVTHILFFNSFPRLIFLYSFSISLPFNIHSFFLSSSLSVPGGNIPRVETKKRECWKFLDWRLNSENDSRVHGQPSFATIQTSMSTILSR